MSKLSRDTLYSTIHDIIQSAKDREVDFLESITLQITLKHYDPQKTRPFTSTGEPLIQVCMLGDQQHCEEAANLNVPCMNTEELKNLNQNKKLLKKLTKDYDGFLASETIIDQIPLILGPGLERAGKSPGVLTHGESMEEKIEGLKVSIKDEMKKILLLNVDVGHVHMTTEELADNVVWSINYLVALLKKNWHNVKSVYIKSSTGPSLQLEYTL